MELQESQWKVCAEEETKDVFYSSWKYLKNGVDIKSELVRCAPMGIYPKKTVHNNFISNIPVIGMLSDVKFTVFKA